METKDTINLIAVDVHDESKFSMAIVARILDERSWFYFNACKPTNVEFGDHLRLELDLHNDDKDKLYLRRNEKLSFRVFTEPLTDSIIKEVDNSPYDKMDREYQMKHPDGYLRRKYNG